MIDLQNDCQKELENTKKEFEDFIYIVSHDIKAPLRAVSNLACWIEEDLGSNANEEVLNNLGLLQNRINRLENMMNALLELSRVKSIEMEMYEVNIPKMVKDTTLLIDKKEGIEIKIDHNLVNENCNTLGKKLQKVIFYLLDNAVRFHDKKKGDVFVEINENDNFYEIKISDNGPGIPETVKDKIFSIFYTVNSKDAVDTTGAGLAISKKIMKMVGGELHYSPTENKGSLFIINWPKNINLKT